MTVENQEETLLEFPARFPIKAMGKNTPEFISFLESIAAQIPADDFIEIQKQPSKNGNFLAVTIYATFHNKPSIDAIYQQLSASDLVLMAL